MDFVEGEQLIESVLMMIEQLLFIFYNRCVANKGVCVCIFLCAFVYMCVYLCVARVYVDGRENVKARMGRSCWRCDDVRMGLTQEFKWLTAILQHCTHSFLS